MDNPTPRIPGDQLANCPENTDILAKEREGDVSDKVYFRNPDFPAEAYSAQAHQVSIHSR
jgi:hypothetical protein